MTFKELANELMDQGWRAYYVKDSSSLGRDNKLQRLAIRNLIEVVVYEGKQVVFVKSIPPTPEPREKPTYGL